MFISEAAALALESAKGIARREWSIGYKTYVIPTNTENCCLLVLATENRAERGWQPQANDLIAGDWEVVF